MKPLYDNILLKDLEKFISRITDLSHELHALQRRVAELEDVTDKVDEEELTLIQWQGFLEEVQNLKDPLLISIFKHMTLENTVHYDEVLEATFPTKRTDFIDDKLQESQKQWLPILNKYFPFAFDIRII